MIRLSAKLEAAGTYVTEEDGQYETAPEDNGGVSVSASDSTDVDAQAGKPIPLIPASLQPTSLFGNREKKKKMKKKKPKASNDSSQGKGASRHASMNPFNSLLDVGEEENLDLGDLVDPAKRVISTEAWSETQEAPNSEPPSWEVDESAQHTGGPYALPKIKKKEPMVVMPQFDSDFWRVYGNKLRVFGTEENVLALTG